MDLATAVAMNAAKYNNSVLPIMLQMFQPAQTQIERMHKNGDIDGLIDLYENKIRHVYQRALCRLASRTLETDLLQDAGSSPQHVHLVHLAVHLPVLPQCSSGSCTGKNATPDTDTGVVHSKWQRKRPNMAMQDGQV